MIQSSIDICNLALDRCKEKNITSLSEETKSAQKCAAWYDIVRRSLLTNLNASFSIKRATLAEYKDYVPVFGYEKAFVLPKDCLQILNVGDPTLNELYQIEGKYFYCKEDIKEVHIRYIADIQDVMEFDAHFIKLFSTSLAAEICEPLTHDTEMANYLRKLAQEQYVECSTKYGRDNRMTVIKGSRFRQAKINAGIETVTNYIR